MNRNRMVQLLIGKSLLETLLVGGLAVGFYIHAFPPYFHGWSEINQNGIAGWAVDNARPWDHVKVQLFIDGILISGAAADQSRPDVVAKGWAKDEWHGYHFSLPELNTGPHEARIYAMHESGAGRRITLQLLGDPVRFTTP